MTETSLLRLARAYEKGQLNRETYRRRRAEAIESMLEMIEDDETLTKDNPVRARAAAAEKPPVTTPQLEVPAGKPNTTMIIGGAVALLVVIGAAIMLISGDEPDEAAPAPQEVVSTPSGTPISNLQVMISYTDDILADGNLSDVEISKLNTLWLVAKPDEQEGWQAYADEKLINAYESGDEALAVVMEDLYFDLDLETPDYGDALPPPPPPPEEMIADTTAQETMEDATEMVESVEEEAAALAQETVSSVEEAIADAGAAVAAEVESQQGALDEAVAGESAVVEENVAELTETVEAATETMAEEVAAVTTEAETPAPAPEDLAAAVDAVIAAGTAAAPEPVVVEEAVEEAVFEPTEALIAAQQESLERTGADVPAAIATLVGDESLSLESLTQFNQTYSQANRNERLAAIFSEDADDLQTLYEAVRDAEQTLVQEGQALGNDRYRGLQQASRALRQLSRRSRSASVPIAGIADDGEMPASLISSMEPENYTLQLLGSSNRDGVRDYIQSHGDLDNLFYVALTRDGSPWYVVMQGKYPAKDVALIVYESFPAAIREERARAWSRSFESIQAVLKNR